MSVDRFSLSLLLVLPSAIVVAITLAEGQQCSSRVDFIVTGGAGFIGGHLVKRILTDYPSSKVLVLDNLFRGSLDNLPDSPRVVFRQIDLRKPELAMAHVACATTVFHLADIVAGVDWVFSHQLKVFHDNVLINTNVLAAAETNGLRNYLYVGTACSYPLSLQMTYDVVHLRENQTYPALPESSYGWSKLMGEYEALLSNSSLRVAILRLHNVYGPNQVYGKRGSQAIPSLIRKSINFPSEDYTVWGSGRQYRDFIHVADVVSGLTQALQFGMGQGVIQLSTNQPVQMRLCAHLVSAMANAIFSRKCTASFDANQPEGDRGRVGIWDKANATLRWRPTVQFVDGLANQFVWVLRRMVAGTNRDGPYPALLDSDRRLEAQSWLQQHGDNAEMVLARAARDYVDRGDPLARKATARAPAQKVSVVWYSPSFRSNMRYYTDIYNGMKANAQLCYPPIDHNNACVRGDNFWVFFPPNVVTYPHVFRENLDQFVSEMARLKKTRPGVKARAAVFLNKVYKPKDLAANVAHARYLAKKVAPVVLFTWSPRVADLQKQTGAQQFPFYFVPFGVDPVAFNLKNRAIHYAARPYDVFFRGDTNPEKYRLRAEIVARRQDLRAKGIKVHFPDHFLSEGEYKRVLSSTRIVLSTIGMPGRIDLIGPRHYEVMMSGSCLLLCQRSDTYKLQASGIVEGQTAIMFDNFTEMVDKILYYRDRAEEVMAMVRRAQEIALQHHTWAHRGQYIVSKLSKFP